MTSVLPFQIGDISVGGGHPFVFIGGPCVIESERHATDLAIELAAIAARLKVPFIFKASYDKANRTSGRSFRGPGLIEGLRVLASIKARTHVPILTDIHETSQAAAAAEVADVLQIPAFLCRQTDLLVAAAKTGRAVNIKKGQFLAPDDISHAVAKVIDAGNARVMITERGTSFGYHNLIVDMRAFPMMRDQGLPVVFDVTHSLQLPGRRRRRHGRARAVHRAAGLRRRGGGRRRRVPGGPRGSGPREERCAERPASRSSRTAAAPLDGHRCDCQAAIGTTRPSTQRS